MRSLYARRYNARRGNVEEDMVLIRLAHGLIATLSKRKSVPKLHQAESSAPSLPVRLVDIGLGPGQFPRVVDMVGQTPRYVALSYSWGASRTRLTSSNLQSFQKSIKPSEVQEWQAAIDLTRKLGVQYLWIDSLCVVQDDQEEILDAISDMRRIFSSCVGTLIEARSDTFKSPLDQSIDCRPFSMFLNWSQPEEAFLVQRCLQTPSWSWDSRSWTHQELILSHEESVRMRLRDGLYNHRICEPNDQAIIEYVIEWVEEPKTSEDVKKNNIVYADKLTQTHTEVNDAECDEASIKIDDGIRYVDTSKYFEALASFTAAKELISVIKPLNQRSRKIHAIASAGISTVYLTQNLPAIALGIVEAALAFHSGLPLTKYSLALE